MRNASEELTPSESVQAGQGSDSEQLPRSTHRAAVCRLSACCARTLAHDLEYESVHRRQASDVAGCCYVLHRVSPRALPAGLRALAFANAIARNMNVAAAVPVQSEGCEHAWD